MIGLAAAQAAAIRVGGHHPPPTAMSLSFVPSSFAPDVFHFPDAKDLLYYEARVSMFVCVSLCVFASALFCARALVHPSMVRFCLGGFFSCDPAVLSINDPTQ